jgi:hypothetical protein
VRVHSRTKPILLAFVLAIAIPATKPAHASWSYFYVTNANGTKIAEVAEQIFPASLEGFPASYGLDYEYRVLNITPNHTAIDGFQVFVGNQAGLVQQQNFVNPPHYPLGYGAQFGPLGNGSVPFLTAEGNTYSPVPWRFQEFDQRPGVITGYDITWSFTGGQPLPWNRWTQFDLFSPNGPVPGGGAVDPLAGPGSIGVELAGNSSFNSSQFTGTVPVSTTVDGSNPFPGSTAYGPAAVPEPSSLILIGSGLTFLGVVGLHRAWRRS